MKILKLFTVALLCVALLMALIACAPDENAEGGEGNGSFWENVWDSIIGGDNNADESGKDPQEPSQKENNGDVVNDLYPDYGTEFEY